MNFLTFMCRLIAVTAGFFAPVVAGLYCVSNGKTKQASFYLRVLLYWIILDAIVAPLMEPLLGFFSTLLWPIAFTGLSVALVIPGSRVIELGESYLTSTINNSHYAFLTEEFNKITEKASVEFKAIMERFSDSPKKDTKEE